MYFESNTVTFFYLSRRNLVKPLLPNPEYNYFIFLKGRTDLFYMWFFKLPVGGAVCSCSYKSWRRAHIPRGHFPVLKQDGSCCWECCQTVSVGLNYTPLHLVICHYDVKVCSYSYWVASLATFTTDLVMLANVRASCVFISC